MTSIVGIDLGTTFSLVAAVDQGRPRIITDQGERLIPSVVGFSTEAEGEGKGKLLVGTPARNQAVLEPDNTVKSIKRKMGTDERVTLAGQPYTPQEISAFILRQLKHMAERDLGQAVERAVITVPAYFPDAARQATKDAGEIAGFEVARIINEPTAAALAYGLERDVDQKVAVYDLGGGTFDVSIVELSQGVIEVRASHGNTRLGGDDFDELIVQHVADQFQAQHGVDLRCNVTVMALEGDVGGRLRRAHLSDGDALDVDVAVVALGTGIVLGASAHSDFDTLDKRYPDHGITDPNDFDLRDSARTKQTTANVMFGEPVFAASQRVRAGGAQVLSEFIATFASWRSLRWVWSKPNCRSIPVYRWEDWIIPRPSIPSSPRFWTWGG